jgi:hypothetical protein
MMKFFYSICFHLLLFPVALGQNNGDPHSSVFNRDIIQFNNGDSVCCEVIEVTEDMVFYEQIQSLGLSSASLSEVQKIKHGLIGLLNLSDTTKAMNNDSLYRQGRMDAKKYYMIHLKNKYSNSKNPRNALLSNPSYAAGFKDGAKSKKSRRVAIILICSPLILPMILGFIFYCLIMVS